MIITKKQLKQIIQEELSATLLGQWTTEGLRDAIANGLKPRKGPRVSAHIWNEGIRRCLEGESEYCPLNYGIERESEVRMSRRDIERALPPKPTPPPKRKKRKPPRKTWEKIWPEDPNCPWCELIAALRGFGGSGGRSPAQLRAATRAIRGRATGQSGRRFTKGELANIIKFGLEASEFNDIATSFWKNQLHRIHNIYRTLTPEQQRYVIRNIR